MSDYMIAWYEPHPIEFRSFGKIFRYFREAIVTEKIDGTQAAIGIQRYQFGVHAGTPAPASAAFTFDPDDSDGLPRCEFLVYAQSRNRVITPDADNYGFARWVWDNAASLVRDLGEGLHYGEWWGQGINRGYGMTGKCLSLFNVKRWEDAEFRTPGLGAVPVLTRGVFSEAIVSASLAELGMCGSFAAPGYMRPEGVVVYHTAGNVMFKATLEDDDQPKSLRKVQMELAA